MNTRQVIEEVIQNKMKDVPVKNSQGERLYDDLGLDSLDVMEIIMECEIRLGVKIPDSMCTGLKIKEDLYRLFEQVEQDMQELYDKLIELICSGNGETYANMDFIKFKPGTVQQINDTLIRINERKKMFEEYNIPYDLKSSENGLKND